MTNLIYRVKKFFDLKLGWFFINGMRQDWYAEEMRKKYGDNREV